jgi:hypothetical protein
MTEVEFSPWYINTRRLADVTDSQIDFHAQSPIEDNSQERVRAMDQAHHVARALFKSGKIQNLESLISQGQLVGHGRVVAAVWSNVIFRGAPATFSAPSRGLPRIDPSMSAQIVVGDEQIWFNGQLRAEHYFSDSSVYLMSGQKQVFIAGQFQLDTGAKTGTFYPWMVGDLVEKANLQPFLMGGWNSTAEVHAATIEGFEPMAKVRPPAESRLRSIMGGISESSVKSAFAEILGEPFVPKDWSGERSDLYTSRVRVNGIEISAAFLLKGPAVSGALHPRDLGRRGDQIVRLFDEPADLLVVQHAHKIETTVRKIMRAFAVDAIRPRRYCVIDGADTYRILRASSFIDNDGEFSGCAR